MLKKLRIENFRAFSKLELFKLKQFNLLTGTNGAGKTSVLEAVFLNCAGANPQLALSLESFRGQENKHPLVDTPFRSLFRDLSPSNTIQIVAEETKNLKSYDRHLRMEAIYAERTLPGKSSSTKFVSGISSTFSGHKSDKLKARFAWRLDAALSKLRVPNQGPISNAGDIFDVVQPPQPDLIFARYLSPYLTTNRQELANQLGVATRGRSLVGVLDILKILEPRVQNLVPLLDEGEQIIYVDTGEGEMKPIQIMGAGLSHLLQLALALDEIEDGLILYDELENGLHYSIHDRVVRAIMSTLKTKPNLQIIATTHSSEMIQAVARTLVDEKFESVCVYNVSGKTGRSTQFDSDEIVKATQAEFDLR